MGSTSSGARSTAPGRDLDAATGRRHALPKMVERARGPGPDQGPVGFGTPGRSRSGALSRAQYRRAAGTGSSGAGVGVPEVYLQRMVFFAQEPDRQFGWHGETWRSSIPPWTEQESIIAECEALCRELGIGFAWLRRPDPSGQPGRPGPQKSGPGRLACGPDHCLCDRERQLPALLHLPFRNADYDSLILGNLSERPFSGIWNDRPYREFRSQLLSGPSAQGLRELRGGVESVIGASSARGASLALARGSCARQFAEQERAALRAGAHRPVCRK